MDYTIRFAQHVKAYIDRIPQVVWTDFERSFLPGTKWQENEILRTSILKDGFDELAYLKEANKNPVFRLDVNRRDFGGSGEETLTGADLALIFALKCDGKLISQRLVFVQLKRPYFDNNKTEFKALHEKSGKSFFGEDIHQARKLLLSSNHSYYWFAMTSGILRDSDSLGIYLKDSNLRQIHQQSSSPVSSNLTTHATQFGSLFDSIVMKEMHKLTDSEFEGAIFEYMHYPEHWGYLWRHLLRHSTARDILLHYRQMMDQLPYIYLSDLRNRLREAASIPFGMVERIGLLVCHAESVLGLEATGEKSFQNIYDVSIPFSHFILHHILGDDFGESNGDLITAVQEQDGDAKDYIKDKIRQAAYLYGLKMNFDSIPDDIGVIKHVVNITLNVTALAASEG